MGRRLCLTWYEPASAELQLSCRHLELLLASASSQGERLGLSLHERWLRTLLDLPVELPRLRLPALARRWCSARCATSVLALHLQLLLSLLLIVPIAQRAELLWLAHLLLWPWLLLGGYLESLAPFFRSQSFCLWSTKRLGMH